MDPKVTKLVDVCVDCFNAGRRRIEIKRHGV